MKWLLALALAVSAMAGDINGKWKAKFDTQIGEQHYTYQFKADGEKLTGTATNDMGSTEIKEGTIKGDDSSLWRTWSLTAWRSALNTPAKSLATRSSSRAKWATLQLKIW